MAYADADDYALYGDGSIPSEGLDKALDQASDEIDILTYSRIVGIGFANLTPFQQTRVKKAVCQHADFLTRYGDFLNVPFSSYGAGSTSMSFGKDQSTGAGGIQTSSAVLNLLKATGLTNRRLC
jgi:hypothetical protein